MESKHFLLSEVKFLWKLKRQLTYGKNYNFEWKCASERAGGFQPISENQQISEDTSGATFYCILWSEQYLSVYCDIYNAVEETNSFQTALLNVSFSELDLITPQNFHVSQRLFFPY